LHSEYSTILVQDSTIAGNFSSEGGGIFLYNATSAQLDNSTIAFNAAISSAGPYGGGVFAYISNSGPVTVTSTVIGENIAGQKGPGQDLFVSNGLSVGASYSLIESFNSGSISQAGSPSTPNVIEYANPLLEPLHKNGGFTLTCEPLPTKSPLIGKGSNPDKLPTDQRGRAREVLGSTDIGAVEIA
jgi:hypothetical protein